MELLPIENNDPSIIDVTTEKSLIPSDEILGIKDESREITLLNSEGILTKLAGGVPYWSQRFIFDARDVRYISRNSKWFYDLLKEKFINGINIDVEGNTNYIFLLLFQLLDETKDNDLLERLIKRLIKAYPFIKSFAVYHLIRKLEDDFALRDPLFNQAVNIILRSNIVGADIIKEELMISSIRAEKILEQLQENEIITKPDDNGKCTILINHEDSVKPILDNLTTQHLVENFPDYYWSLGQRYGAKLNLNSLELRILDSIRFQENNFTSIGEIREAIIKLFLVTIRELEKQYKAIGSSLKDEMKILREEIATKYFHYKKTSQKYFYWKSISSGIIFHNILKLIENIFRDIYNVKRKAIPEKYCYLIDIQDSRGLNMFTEVRKIALENVEYRDLSVSTELILNAQNVNRWKFEFDEILKSSKNGQEFMDSVDNLIERNIKNLNYPLIYFESIKKVQTYDASLALIFYLLYVKACKEISNITQLRPFPKSVQNKIFKNLDQIIEFNAIIKVYIEKNNFEETYKEIKSILKPKRKLIELDSKSIKEVSKSHDSTVGLLNEYLGSDDDEGSEIELGNKKVHVSENLVLSVKLTEFQVELIRMFVDNDYFLTLEKIKQYADTKGYFLNQLVNGINEVYYELLDDNIIYEENGVFIMDKEYYKEINSQ